MSLAAQAVGRFQGCHAPRYVCNARYPPRGWYKRLSFVLANPHYTGRSPSNRRPTWDIVTVRHSTRFKAVCVLGHSPHLPIARSTLALQTYSPATWLLSRHLPLICSSPQGLFTLLSHLRPSACWLSTSSDRRSPCRPPLFQMQLYLGHCPTDPSANLAGCTGLRNTTRVCWRSFD